MQHQIKSNKPPKLKATKIKPSLFQGKPVPKKDKLSGRKDKLFNERKLEKDSSEVKTKKIRISLPSDESIPRKQQKTATRKQQEIEMSESEADSSMESDLPSHASDVEDAETNEASDSEHDNSDVVLNKKNKKTKKKETQVLNWKDPEVRAEIDSRTVFVGNVKATIKKSQLQKLFREFGRVLSVRLRCVTPAHPGVSKRMAAIKKLIHPKRTSVHAYVTFENREGALKSLQLNGNKFEGHRLRVAICSDSGKPDPRKAIFVGNLPFDAEDDDLWAALESCGQIKSVRVVRNAGTGMGIGVGYVNFESTDAVELALQLEDVQIKHEVIRIFRYQENPKQGRNHQVMQEANKTSGKKYRNTMGDREQKKPPVFSIKQSAFQGSTSAQKKKKRKLNKGLLQKMRISRKIAPKSEN